MVISPSGAQEAPIYHGLESDAGIIRAKRFSKMLIEGFS